jgi:membrane fusion protein, heavy metal efflux system
MKHPILTVVGLLAIVGAGMAYWLVPRWLNAEHSADEENTVSLAEAKDVPLYITVLPKMMELGGIRTVEVHRPTHPQVLELRGQLNFDPNNLVYVRARFPGQVIELATVEQVNALSTSLMTVKRTVAYMDKVTKGQRLATLWSKDLGEKKSELVTALIRFRNNSTTLKRLNELEEAGGTAGRAVRDIRQAVEEDETNIERTRMTLLSWRLSKEEIAKVEAEADRIQLERVTRNLDVENDWAQVRIEAPIDGTIVEKNVVEGVLVDTDNDLFAIADLTKLRAMLHVYEEDLPELQKLEKPTPWLIRVASRPEAPSIPSAIDQLGDVIDPNEHMALAFGTVDNTAGDLFAGQFITATVELPQEPDLVEIPTRALIEDGIESVVLVRIDPEKHQFAARRVKVVRRYHDVVYVRERLSAEEKQTGLEELRVGDVVVAAGALELKAAMESQIRQPRAASSSDKK